MHRDSGISGTVLLNSIQAGQAHLDRMRAEVNQLAAMLLGFSSVRTYVSAARRTVQFEYPGGRAWQLDVPETFREENKDFILQFVLYEEGSVFPRVEYGYSTRKHVYTDPPLRRVEAVWNALPLLLESLAGIPGVLEELRPILNAANKF